MNSPVQFRVRKKVYKFLELTFLVDKEVLSTYVNKLSVAVYEAD